MNTQSTTYDSTNSFEIRAIASTGDISADVQCVVLYYFQGRNPCDMRRPISHFPRNRLLATKERAKHSARARSALGTDLPLNSVGLAPAPRSDTDARIIGTAFNEIIDGQSKQKEQIK